MFIRTRGLKINLGGHLKSFRARLFKAGSVCIFVCVCVWREEVIITKGSRGSGESGVFEQRRESSPVVQSCKRVDMSEETTAANAKKQKEASNRQSAKEKHRKH